jgi:hypothetical protein
VDDTHRGIPDGNVDVARFNHCELLSFNAQAAQ